VAGWTPPPVAEGYTRFLGPIIHGVTPGSDVTWCQYVSAPFDHDVDVLDTGGGESKYGHHIIAYATTKVMPVGTSRECLDADGLSLGYLGGAGGEGVTGVGKLPDGIVFRLRAGQLIMLNAHFINPSSETVDVQGYIDLKLAEPSPDRTPAGLFTNVGTTFNIPSSEHATHDAYCTVQKDLSIFLFGNHMHQWGSSIYTEVKRAGTDTVENIRRDDIWKKEYQFAPEITYFQKDQFLQLHPGDVVHTHCEWDNSETHSLNFPSEMCVGFSYYAPATVEIDCLDGEWPSED
jgi:hypothetical protein